MNDQRNQKLLDILKRVLLKYGLMKELEDKINQAF